MAEVAAQNEETMDAWNGVLFDRFVEYRDVIATSLGRHGERALEIYGPEAGQRVVDIGCGFGDTTRAIGEMVGPEGLAVGIDIAPRFIDLAREEAAADGADHVSFAVADLETTPPEGRFDVAFSRFGTMFFANPVPAMRNIRSALVSGGRLCMVVWRQKIDNPWLHTAEKIVEQFVEEEEDSDEPTCGPGPFSMAGADTTSAILLGAGFEDVNFFRSEIEVKVAETMDRALEFVMAIGPAGEVIRLAGDAGVEMRPKMEAALRSALAGYRREDGSVWVGSSTWIVTAQNPG